MLIVSLISDNHIFNLLSSLFMVNLRVLASLSDPKQNLEEHKY